jgi:hypothetical protein
MPRISFWKNEQYGTDAVWLDKHISEQFSMGGVDAYCHLYLNAGNTAVKNDATQPAYPNQSALNIQDLLFLENRDRKYSPNIYKLRCHYSIQELDLDLSQWGLVIAAGTLYITFHLNDMVDIIGRKLMSGDVLELPNLKEFYSMDDTIPVALKRFYVVQDASRSAMGYGADWWPHLWRVKCAPMVDSQEFKDILDKPVLGVNGLPININGNVTTYGNISSSLNVYQQMDSAIVSQAEYDVPKSGYNTDALWTPLYVNGNPKDGVLPPGSSPEQKYTGYLVGNGKAVNGYQVTPAIAFPNNPTVGQYVLRQDYFPARLFRYTGKMWQYVNENVRTPLTNGLGETQRDTFINNSNTFINNANVVTPILQNLNNLFRPDKGGQN